MISSRSQTSDIFCKAFEGCSGKFKEILYGKYIMDMELNMSVL